MKVKEIVVFVIVIILAYFPYSAKSEPIWGQPYYMSPNTTLSAITGDSTYVLDNTTEKIAFTFTQHGTWSTINRMRIRVTDTSGNGVNIRIETTDANGHPTGNLADPDATINNFYNNSWAYFAGNVTLNDGVVYAIVIQKASAGGSQEIEVSEDPQHLYPRPPTGTSDPHFKVLYSADGSSWTEMPANPIYAMRTTSSGDGVPVMTSSPFNFGTSGWTTNSLGVGEAFEPDVSLNVSGVYVYIKRRGSPPQYIKYRIDQISDIMNPGSITTTLIEGQMKELINDKKWWKIPFPVNVSLNSGTSYALKLYVDSYDNNTDCIIFPAGGEWYACNNIVPPYNTASTHPPSGYAITLTNGNWGALHRDSSSREDADICFKFRTVEGGLGSITLNSPADGTTETVSTPTLVWSPVTGASYYEVYISTNNNFSTFIRSYATTTSTQWTVDFVCENRWYYWKVRAVNTNNGYTSLSTISSFTVNAGGGAEVGTYTDPVTFTTNDLYWGQQYVMNPADAISLIKAGEGDPNASNYILDNTTEKIAFLFAVRETVDVGRMRIRIANELSTPVTIRIETVSNGKPTGKLVNSNSFILGYNQNNWTYFNNNATVTFSNNHVYAIVMKLQSPGSNEIQASEYPANGDNELFWDGVKPNKYNVLYSADGVNYSSLDIFPIFAMRPPSGGPVPNLGSPFNYGTSVWTTNSLGIGQIFVPQQNINISSIEYYAKRRGSPPQYVKVALEQLTNINDPNSVVATNIMCQTKEKVLDKKWFSISLPTNIMLTAGNIYILKLYVDSYDNNTDCIIFPAGGEWYAYTNVRYPGYAVYTTDGINWATLKSSYEADYPFRFRLVKGILSVTPTPLSPANGTIITNDTTPTFEWKSVNGITHYEFYISTNSNFLDPYFKYYSLSSGTNWEIPDSLSTNVVYYWRIRAVNSNTGEVSLSPVSSFRITNIPGLSKPTQKEEEIVTLKNYGLADVYPNIVDPSMNGEVTIKFKSEEEGTASLYIYNVFGKIVYKIGEYSVDADEVKEVKIDLSQTGIGRGVYFVILKTPVSVSRKKIVIK